MRTYHFTIRSNGTAAVRYFNSDREAIDFARAYGDESIVIRKAPVGARIYGGENKPFTPLNRRHECDRCRTRPDRRL